MQRSESTWFCKFSFIECIEVRVVNCLQSRYTFVWIKCHQSRQEVYLKLIQCWCMLTHRHASELGERRLEVWQFEGVGPVILIGCAKYFENLKNLINFTVAHKQRFSLDHLCEDASCRPQVNTQWVGFLPKKNLRTPVPKRHDLMGVCFNRKTESSRQSKVSKLDCLTIRIN